MKISFPHTNVSVFFVLLLLGLSLYSNVFYGEFISDDYVHIINNPAVRDLTQVDRIWRSFNTRFLVGFTFALNYALSGFNTFGYHLVNILLHVLTAFVVYQFIVLTLQLQKFDNKPARSLALVAALIYLCHPIQTQSVAFVTQRFIIMAVLFYMLTVFFYVKSRVEKRQDFYILSLAAMFLGAFSKEMIITVPIMLAAYEFYFLRKPGETFEWKPLLQRILPHCLILLVLPLALLQDRLGSNLELKHQVLGRSIDWHYFLTEINVLRTYLRLLFLPVNQNHDYDYPIAQSLWEPSTLWSFALLAGVAVAAYKMFAKERVISFCIVWFFIATSVEFFVVSIVNRGVIYEHWLYLPMVGFAFAMTVLLKKISLTEHAFRALFIVLVGVYCLLTYQRNFVWQNEIRFWQDVIAKSPAKAGPYFGLAEAYAHKNNKEQAMANYQKALEFDPNFTYAHNNLAILYAREGKDALAIAHLKKALAVNPYYGRAYNNLAYIAFLSGHCEEALNYYEQSLKYQSEYPDAFYYMAQCLKELGRKDKAGAFSEKAVALYKKNNDPEGAAQARELLESLR